MVGSALADFDRRPHSTSFFIVVALPAKKHGDFDIRKMPTIFISQKEIPSKALASKSVNIGSICDVQDDRLLLLTVPSVHGKESRGGREIRASGPPCTHWQHTIPRIGGKSICEYGVILMISIDTQRIHLRCLERNLSAKEALSRICACRMLEEASLERSSPCANTPEPLVGATKTNKQDGVPHGPKGDDGCAIKRQAHY